AIGLSADERVRAVAEERRAPALPPSEEQAIQAALDSNQELRKLESQIAAKGLEMRGAKAERWPKMDLVAQYGMLAKFNNYAEFFQKFQRNNVQLGVSFQLPLFTGSGVSAQIAQAQIDISHLRIELGNSRNRLASDLQQAFRDVKKAQTAAEVAGLDLDVAREQLSMDLAQMQEGRAPLRQVEEARIVENHKWIAFYDAQYALEKAKWNVLRWTGEVEASVEALPDTAR
ncbi:MAG: TolC family protein, partial [Bryobacteraceae bacterium]